MIYLACIWAIDWYSIDWYSIECRADVEYIEALLSDTDLIWALSTNVHEHVRRTPFSRPKSLALVQSPGSSQAMVSTSIQGPQPKNQATCKLDRWLIATEKEQSSISSSQAAYNEIKSGRRIFHCSSIYSTTINPSHRVCLKYVQESQAISYHSFLKGWLWTT